MADNLDELIERLRELLAKATPGPWQYHGSHFYGPDASETAMLIGQIVSGDGRCPHDRNLVTGAINALPTLLDALTALKAERDALRAAIAWVNEVHPTNCDGYARVGMTFEEFAAMKAALQQKDRNDEN